MEYVIQTNMSTSNTEITPEIQLKTNIQHSQILPVNNNFRQTLYNSQKNNETLHKFCCLHKIQK